MTVQSDDARSVEIHAGGQTYRISRDGAIVSNVTAPPPYPGPPLEGVTEEGDDEVVEAIPRPSIDSTDTVTSVQTHREEILASVTRQRDQSLEGLVEDLQRELERSRQQVLELSRSRSMDVGSSHAAIVQDFNGHNVDLVDMPIRTHQSESMSTEVYSSNSQRTMTGMESLQRLKSMISLKWYGSEAGTMRHLVDEQATILRRTQSESSSLGHVRLPNHEAEKNTTTPHLNSRSCLDLEQRLREADISAENAVDLSIENEVDRARSIAVSSATQHYQQLMRDLDRRHRKALHERDVELAKYRELLDNQDKVYRQQLRERDFTIDGLKQQVSLGQDHSEGLWKQYLGLEETLEAKLEKARNEVEDIWEKRWKEYELLLTSKLKLAQDRKS